ncbi:MAG: hypothetical protein NVSMB49_07270 [Ktedonobacteraceae bacterium]
MTTNFQPSIPPEQPMIPSTSHTASSYSSPYLPAGAPPWPTAALQRPPLATATSPSTMRVGRASDRKPRIARSVLTTLGLIALTLLVGVGLTYGVLYFSGQVGRSTPHSSTTLAKVTAQPTNSVNTSTPAATAGTLPTPTSFSTMSSDHQKSLGVLVKYPSDWVEEPSSQPSQNGTAVAAFHPQQQQLGIVVYVGKFSVAGSGVTTTTALNQGLISTLYSGGGNSGNTNLQPIQPENAHRTFAGEQWDEQDATFSDVNSVPIRIASIAVKHGSFFYGFIFLAPDVYYNDVDQKYVSPMLDSFKFLS